ncbi:hypothetical protein [Bradyrhizobium sp. DASA03120]|uniref:hypothetical protein n=1 Tax=Bradyrhizobium sp. SMVTL-02 TaxID=3395917 RepID=UPI003F6EC249
MSSQDYFHIYSDFHLLFLPLLESRFLLHLPDIYHELCHPLHSHLDAPNLEPYADAFTASLFAMVGYFQNQTLAAERLRNQEARLFQLRLWRTCWTKYWTEEFFCDLFGVLTAGPAYVWSHYHLSVKRGGDPFATPIRRESTHPADDARMRAILFMLRSLGAFDSEAQLIERTWHKFISMMGYRAPAEYYLCYPDKQIETLVLTAREGIEKIGIVVATSTAHARVRDTLNNAWRVFWQLPASFAEWESNEASTLLSSPRG